MSQQTRKQKLESRDPFKEMMTSFEPKPTQWKHLYEIIPVT